MAQAHLQATLKPQTPEAYSRNKFLFLSNSKPFSALSLNVQFKEDHVIIPASRARGIHPRSEFTPIKLISDLTLAINCIEEFRSSALEQERF